MTEGQPWSLHWLQLKVATLCCSHQAGLPDHLQDPLEYQAKILTYQCSKYAHAISCIIMLV